MCVDYIFYSSYVRIIRTCIASINRPKLTPGCSASGRRRKRRRRRSIASITNMHNKLYQNYLKKKDTTFQTPPFTHSIRMKKTFHIIYYVFIFFTKTQYITLQKDFIIFFISQYYKQFKAFRVIT
jgi:hypothetical protein